MTELLAVLAGLASGLALCAVAISAWAARIGIELNKAWAPLNYAMAEQKAANGWFKSEIATLKNELELMKQLQYAETGIYNMTTDKATGKQSWVKAQELEDSYIREHSKSPDELLEAIGRMSNGRA